MHRRIFLAQICEGLEIIFGGKVAAWEGVEDAFLRVEEDRFFGDEGFVKTTPRDLALEIFGALFDVVFGENPSQFLFVVWRGSGVADETVNPEIASDEKEWGEGEKGEAEGKISFRKQENPESGEDNKVNNA